MKASVEQLSVADLKMALPGLSKIVARKPSLPVLGCVKVMHAPDHTVRLQANNLEEVVTVRLSQPGAGTPGELLVPLEELATIAKRCAAGETIQLRDTGKETSLVYSAAGSRIEKPVAHLDLMEFPPCDEVTAEPLSLDNAFKTAIREAFECACTDSSRLNLNGACLDVESSQQAHYVVGTDGRHLYSANSFLFDIPRSLIIPNGKFIVWPGFQDDGPWTLRFRPEDKKKSALFRIDSERWTYVARPIEGVYPNWKQIVPDGKGPSKILLGEPGVKTILEALPLLPGGGGVNQPVSLEIKGDELVLKARADEKDKWSCLAVPAQVAGPGVAISFNRIYLARALKFGCTEIIVDSPFVPTLFKGKGKTMVIMPLSPDKRPGAAPDVTPPSAAPTAAQAPVAPTPAAASQTENVSAAVAPPEPTVIPAGPTVSPDTRTATARSSVNGPAPVPAPSAFDQMAQQLDAVRDGVKKLLDDVAAAERLLRQVSKEQKAGEKEMSKARSALRSLQNVEL